MSFSERALTGGRSTAGVVRVGDTVRRPPGPNAAFVHALLRHLERVAFAGAPRFLGLDAEGRETLSYLAGEVPSDLGAFSDAALRRAAALLRALHDATAGTALSGSAEVVCHGDASPCNAVFRDGLPYAFIDFDAAHPGARREDVGYAAWLWTDLGNADLPPDTQGARLALFASAYHGEPSPAPVAAMLAAQAELAGRRSASAATRDWASACRAWTLAHRAALERAGSVPGDPT